MYEAAPEPRKRDRVLRGAGILFALALILGSAAFFIRRCGREAPATEEDEIAAKARDLGFDPERISAYVRDEVAPEDYRGFLRGALGTLRSGAGSDADRALLLSELLKRCRKTAVLERGSRWGVVLVDEEARVHVGPERSPEAGAAPVEKIADEDCHVVHVRLRQDAPSGLHEFGRAFRTASRGFEPLQVRFAKADGSPGIGLWSVSGNGNPELLAEAPAGLEETRRLELVLRFVSPGEPPREVRRELFTRRHADHPARAHPSNVHSIFLPTGWTGEGLARRLLAASDRWPDRAAALHARVVLAFLPRSEEFARRLGTAAKAPAVAGAPRALVVSSERDGDRLVVSLDLRRNGIEFRGDARPACAAVRSLHDAALEALAVEEATGKPATSAALLLANAWTGAGATTPERIARLARLLQRVPRECREGAGVRISPAGRDDVAAVIVCAGAVATVRGETGGTERLAAMEGMRGADAVAAELDAQLSARAGLPPGVSLNVRPVRPAGEPWYANARIFSLGGAESRIEFEKQVLSLEPDLEIACVDYYDDVAGKWRDAAFRSQVRISKQDLEGATTFTTWFWGSRDMRTGRTWDMLSRRAYRELEERGWTVLDVVGAEDERFERLKFFRMMDQIIEVPVNSRTERFRTFWIWGAPEKDDPAKPAPGAEWPAIKDKLGFHVTGFQFLDDPDFPLKMGASSFVQTSVPGIVADAETGAGVDGAVVRLDAAKVTANSWPGGEFELPVFRLPFAEFEVRAEAPGYEPFAETFDFRDPKVFPLSIRMKRAPGEPRFVFVASETSGALKVLPLDPHSKELIRDALADRPGLVVAVPAFAVAGSTGAVDAWIEADPETGEVWPRIGDGLYGASTGASWASKAAPSPYALQHHVLSYYSGRIAAWYLFAAGALDAVGGAMDNPAMTLPDLHKRAIAVARDLARMYDSWVLTAPGSPVKGGFRKGLKEGLDWAEAFYGEAWK